MSVSAGIPAELVATFQDPGYYNRRPLLMQQTYLPPGIGRGPWDWTKQDLFLFRARRAHELQHEYRWEQRVASALVRVAIQGLADHKAPYQLRDLDLVSRWMYEVWSEDSNRRKQAPVVEARTPDGRTLYLRPIAFWPRDLVMQDWYAVVRRRIRRLTSYEILKVRFPTSFPLFLKLSGQVEHPLSDHANLEARSCEDPLLTQGNLYGLILLAWAIAAATGLPLYAPHETCSGAIEAVPCYAYRPSVFLSSVAGTGLELLVGAWTCSGPFTDLPGLYIFSFAEVAYSLAIWGLELGLLDKGPPGVLRYLIDRMADPSWPRIHDALLTPAAGDRTKQRRSRREERCG